MGLVELVFGLLVVIFAAIGVVRGYARELGITTMLLLALFVIEFTDENMRPLVSRALEFIAGRNLADQATTKALIYAGFLTLIVFISYQGTTLTFPGAGKSFAYSLGAGLLNGYLYSGSMWWYLGNANYPFVNISKDYSAIYKLAWELLPPHILPWYYVIGLAVFMLIMRVLK